MNVILTPRFDPTTVRVEHKPKLVEMDATLLDSNLVLTKDQREQELRNRNDRDVR